MRPDGTYDILYEDGDSEQGVAVELIRAAMAQSFAVGEKVEARFGGDDDWCVRVCMRGGCVHAVCRASGVGASGGGRGAAAVWLGLLSNRYGGKITAVGGDGTYDIEYDDGDSEQGVASALIRRV